MSTKTSTNSTQAIQYDPSSMSAFSAFQPRIQENYMQDSQLDPTKSSTYNLGLAGMQGAARQMAARNSENFFGNLKAGGYAGNNLSGVQQMGLTGLGMSSSAMSANAFNQNFMNYDLMRRQTVGAMAGYRPLQTGQTQNTTQTQSGLGTWLPQVIGAGLGAVGGYMTGGLGGAFTGAAGGGGSKSGGSGSPGFMGSLAPLPQSPSGFSPSFVGPSSYGTGNQNYLSNPFGSSGSVWGGR